MAAVSTARNRHIVDLLWSSAHRWSQWVLGDPPRHWYGRGRLFCGIVATWPGNATHAVTIVLVVAIGIALDDSDGGNKARNY